MGGEVFFCRVHGEIRQGLGGQPGSRLGFGPRHGRELFDRGELGCGQAREQIFQVIERIDSVPPTTAQQRLNHCAAFPGFRIGLPPPLAAVGPSLPTRIDPGASSAYARQQKESPWQNPNPPNHPPRPRQTFRLFARNLSSFPATPNQRRNLPGLCF